MLLSHCRHAIDLHVAHRTVAVSADDFFADRRRFGGETLDAPVMSGVPPTSAGTARYETEGAADNKDSGRPQGEVQ